MRSPIPTTRRGFSFAEILFAVMILGIGFIMIAAMFPVAIKQTERNGQETTAANMSATAVSNFQQMAVQLASPTAFRNSLLPILQSPTIGPVPNGTLIHGPVLTFHDPRVTAVDTISGLKLRDETWNAICGNLILPSDPRYAWVPMYRRDYSIDPVSLAIIPSPMVQLILIGVETRNQSKYTAPHDLIPVPLTDPTPEAALQGHLMRAVINAPSAFAEPVGNIQFVPDPSVPGNTNPAFDLARAAEGAFVVISDDGHAYNPTVPWPPGAFNGRILKVGAFRPDLTSRHPDSPTYELVPGYDLPAVPSSLFPTLTLNNALVIIVGRGLRVPADKTLGVDGGVQDISVYTTLVRVQ